ncbi:MAG TPA: PhoPQ-activated protein PqaA family protein [Pseudomonadota bacterium]|nr:PhoPQ-activated protein PqaA family protein [Pseudomonadota bacterium]
MKRRSLSSPWLVGIGQRLAGSVLLAALVATAPACDPASAGHNHNHHHDDDEVAPQAELTALAKYVTTPDPAYTWKLRTTVTGTDYTTYFIDMTSQSWRSAAEVDRTVWKHDLMITVPKNRLPGPNILYITGGSNGGTPPMTPSDTSLSLARLVRAPVIELKQVPNQPLTFANHDGMPHTEDGIVAFSWLQAMKTGDPNWSVRFPMVKSAVLAMDTAREFLYSKDGGNLPLDGFVVMGASKRGWTTWLTAAVDPRVVGCVPIVIDVLNVNKFMTQHIESYGFWALSLYDYYYNHITERIGTKEMNTLLQNEDPYFFRDSLKMPKYIVNATNDQFFLPDGSQNYLADLQGEKMLRYVQNADHSLRGSDFLEGIAAFTDGLRRGRPRPSFTWSFEGEDTIRVKTQTAPKEVLLWQATNRSARDYRLETIGRAWTSTPLTDEGGGVYVAKVARPPAGFTAFFIELAFPSDLAVPHKYSTQVRVTPDVRPFAGIDPRTGKLEGL